MVPVRILNVWLHFKHLILFKSEVQIKTRTPNTFVFFQICYICKTLLFSLKSIVELIQFHCSLHKYMWGEVRFVNILILTSNISQRIPSLTITICWKLIFLEIAVTIASSLSIKSFSLLKVIISKLCILLWLFKIFNCCLLMVSLSPQINLIGFLCFNNDKTPVSTPIKLD